MPAYRKFLKNQSLPGPSEMETGQRRGLPLPPIKKPYPQDAPVFDLVRPEHFTIGQVPLLAAITCRRSRRKYSDASLSLMELSFLLWCTQGVKSLFRNGLVTLRTVPSGGGMHPFETYLLVNRVDDLGPGLYRYLAIEHKLCRLPVDYAGLPQRLSEICNGQIFVGQGAVTFIWSVRPGRTEWRYGEDCLKDLLISAGHICQNLYLACEAIDAGTCAVVAYEQRLLDEFIGVDGEDEIAFYLAPVGKRHEAE